MTERPAILIASYIAPELAERIRAAAPAYEVIYREDLLAKPRYAADHNAPVTRTPAQEAEWRQLLGRAEIFFDFDFHNAQELPDLAGRLRWIQGTSAGIGQLVKRLGYAERTDWRFTTASGVHAGPLAEFALLAMLYFTKDLPGLQAAQTARRWQRLAMDQLAGQTLAIVGLGKIGRSIAAAGSALGMRIIGTRRDVSQPVTGVAALYPPDELPTLLRQANFLVLACPHTAETDGLIGAAELAQLPRGAVLINVARGAVVDQPALVAALHSGQLGGAALDVTDPEPPPQDDPIWAAPNVLISPHSASTAVTENERIVTIFIENLRRWQAGEPLLNELDVMRGY
ncbi:MAG: D-2-hydroxyacid dehydrogenase [Chloroflexi bacterium]|nr:D-2-hydroxyacid dehydrogenase [Chloroflexota bacterium]